MIAVFLATLALGTVVGFLAGRIYERDGEVRRAKHDPQRGVQREPA